MSPETVALLDQVTRPYEWVLLGVLIGVVVTLAGHQIGKWVALWIELVFIRHERERILALSEDIAKMTARLNA